jgi:adenylate cyclase
MQRKLAAILSADVAGYSRLMGEDEEATVRTLAAYRTVTDALIRQHRGRVVNTAGDSVLAEFASAVDAVQCAVDIQWGLDIKNADLPSERKMEFRIGINVGDVVVEGEQIYGDGVNVAARLQALADAGGVFLSGTVYDQVKNKLALQYESLGEQTVKNIADPVRVWRIRVEESSSHQVASQKDRRAGFARRKWTLVAGTGLLLSIGTIVGVRYLSFPTPNPQSPTPSTQPPFSTQGSALRTEAAPAALPLPDKPSIAVLPFILPTGRNCGFRDRRFVVW